MVVLFALTWVMLRSTYFGRNIYAIGGNREAARISGIPIVRVTIAVYVFSGFCAGLAGVLQTGRSGAAAPTAATGIELLVAAAVLLGGTRLTGGAGSVTGTAIAILFLATLDNVLTLNGVASYWQLVIVGVLLMAAVTIDRFRSQAA
jgi:ribose/xylose/arabinose/galactoside ABC-type transport system permease subunit